MPRYKFECSSCKHVEIVILSMDESYTDCSVCDSKNTMIKQFDKFFSKLTNTKEQKVGNITKQYIEKNKEVLEQQKKEARSTDYEPS